MNIQEPRIVEYLKKKELYKKNNIEPPFNMEKEFGITDEEFESMSGKKIVNNSSLNLTNEFQIKHDDFKNDPRFAKLQKRIQRDKDATQQRYTSNLFNNRDYTLMENIKTENNQNQEMFLDQKPYMSDYYLNVSRENKRIYKNTPSRIQYKSYHNWGTSNLEHNSDLNPVINDITNYDNKANKNINNKLHLNNITRDNNYEMENTIINGLPERDQNFKSLGFPSSTEYNYDYISKEIQNPDHIIMPFPRPSRSLNNYIRAKPYKRDIY